MFSAGSRFDCDDHAHRHVRDQGKRMAITILTEYCLVKALVTSWVTNKSGRLLQPAALKIMVL